MKLHRFFSPDKLVEQSSGHDAEVGSSVIYSDSSNQFRKVLRFTKGENIMLFDGSGYDFLYEILEYQDEKVILKVLNKVKNNVFPAYNVSLYTALVKKDTFEWIAQKATELGVVDIVPVIADRSEKKSLNTERLRKIIIEAAEQSGRATLPNLREIRSLGDVIQDSSLSDEKILKIVFDPLGKKFSKEDFHLQAKENANTKSIAAFIGPEGGWSQQELDEFKRLGISVCSLGPQILRTETAVIAALAQFVF